MLARTWLLVALTAMFAPQLGCEKLGAVPSDTLACSEPEHLCPAGFFCSGDRCRRIGLPDAANEHATDGGPDEPSAGDQASSIDASDAQDGACVGAGCGTACEDGYRQCPGTQRCVRNSGCCGEGDCTADNPACVSGMCTPRSNGDSCKSDTECGSGHCADTTSGSSTKVCCDVVCAGNCNDGCGGGICKHKPFRTACGEISNAYYEPRYNLCDGIGNCNAPAFPCGGGSGCSASKDIACCGDVNDNLRLSCVAASTCGTGAGNFELSCRANIDCPVGTFCCLIKNPDLAIAGCAPNCQTYAPMGFEATFYAHSQLCDYIRDSSCPAGQTCQGSQTSTEFSECGP